MVALERAFLALAALACLAVLCAEANPMPSTVRVGTGESNSVLPDGRLAVRGSPRSLLIEIARELITRTTGDTQVLSLNATNLVILLVLKALLLGAALFSYGSAHAGRGVSEAEVLLVLSYLMGGTAGNDGGGYGCMQRVACEEPEQATDYLSASRVLLKGAKMFHRIIPFNPKYEHIVYELQEAVDHGQKGQECSAKYRCSQD
ncbi:uncharacterized protein [Hetaerina americana]|uniref:uncharacterized protein n=1 Tax=Hetaerina americana TaxID=62018 RepID=UPI003A7F4490